MMKGRAFGSTRVGPRGTNYDTISSSDNREGAGRV